MTNNEMMFLINQWGQSFTTSLIKDIAGNITKTPNDSIVLAVAIKQVNKRIDDLITTIKTLQGQANTGFNVLPTTPPNPDPLPVPPAETVTPTT